MEAINVLIFAVNACCAAFICCLVSKWLRRMEDKINSLNAAVSVDISRHSYFMLEMLQRMKDYYVERGEYEKASEVQRLINSELESYKEKSEEQQ